MLASIQDVPTYVTLLSSIFHNIPIIYLTNILFNAIPFYIWAQIHPASPKYAPKQIKTRNYIVHLEYYYLYISLSQISTRKLTL